MPPQTYEATDPKTGQKWTWDGKQWNPVAQPSAFDKFSMDVTRGMGLDPEKIRAAYQRGGGVTGQFKEIGSEIGGGLKSFIGSVAQDPAHITDPLHAMASSFTQGAGLPDKLGEQFHAPNVGQMVGAGSMILGGAEGAEKVSVPKPKPIMRDLLGVGKRDVEGYIAKAGEKEATTQAKAAAKVEKAKQNYADAVQEANQKRVEASAKETAAKTKQEALVSKHGPVYQRMNEMADAAQQHVTKLEETVRQAEQKKWDAFKTEMKNPEVETQGVADAITNAQKNILTGESLPIFNQMVKEIGEEDQGIAQMLEAMNPEVRARAMAAGVVPNTGITLDLARRFYTKLNRKLYGAELPSDVYRALKSVSEPLDQSIAKSVVKQGGPEALRDYRSLQKDWGQYRQTFWDKDSPLRKVREAKDPSTKLGPITGETGARAVDYLGRYRDMGAKPEAIGKIRALHKALKELPGGGGKMPEVPERPGLPAKPVAKSVSPEQARQSMLGSKESFYSRPPSRWELMFPPLLAYKMTLKHLMQNPNFRNWLAKE